jgi:predicted SprT family Zn-dependent metalloprotease
MLHDHETFAGEPHIFKHSAQACESGRHSATARAHSVVQGISYAECRHCGCKLMRTAASRRWFRCGVMG